MVILFFGCFNNSMDGGVGQASVVYVYGFCVLLLATPVSLALFYKLIIAGRMLSLGFVIFFVWCVNSIAEQWWLVRCLGG